MARINAEWKKFSAPISAASNWTEMKKWLGVASENTAPLDKCVYIIRTMRPFSIAYPLRPSPVLYIGEGKALARLRDHMKKWIFPLAPALPNLKLEFHYARVNVRGNGSKSAYKDVDADMLDYFNDTFGASPLANSQFENHTREHDYESGFFKVLHPGSGPGYKWALSPLRSNNVYQKSLKGRR